MTVVLDASAVLALVYGEPGAEAVADRLADATISSINAAEVVPPSMLRNRRLNGIPLQKVRGLELL